MTQWEHKAVKVVLGGHANEVTMETPLNRAGTEGWEVVTAFDLDGGASEMHHIWFILKRPVAVRSEKEDAFAKAVPLQPLV
ncbi:MAG: DUF4177 domain-containing protein [Nitrospiraceae bacterium]|nr:DUF4177 domain-containing protein [Nitrospiraceae bacterium]